MKGKDGKKGCERKITPKEAYKELVLHLNDVFESKEKGIDAKESMYWKYYPNYQVFKEDGSTYATNRGLRRYSDGTFKATVEFTTYRRTADVDHTNKYSTYKLSKEIEKYLNEHTAFSDVAVTHTGGEDDSEWDGYIDPDKFVVHFEIEGRLPDGRWKIKKDDEPAKFHGAGYKRGDSNPFHRWKKRRKKSKEQEDNEVIEVGLYETATIRY